MQFNIWPEFAVGIQLYIIQYNPNMIQKKYKN